MDETEWGQLSAMSTNEGAEMVQSKILEAAEEWIPRKKKTIVVKTHDWLTDDVVGLVKAKKAAEGTPEELAAARACSETITADFAKFAERSKKLLLELPKGLEGMVAQSSKLGSARSWHFWHSITERRHGVEALCGRQGQPVRESLQGEVLHPCH